MYRASVVNSASSRCCERAPAAVAGGYSVCRHIARSAAKNFYYGFLVLPARKRNALSAVYAFMRHADDISDDPSIPAEQRREKLDEWMNALRRVVAGERTDDPVLLALADAQQRYNIPLELLEKLVRERQWMFAAQPPECARWRCSAVAVRNLRPALRLLLPRGVGGRSGLHPHLRLSRSARREAGRETGVAFQLTNIIRDVKEDAALGRVYLPREDFARFGVDAHALTNGSAPAVVASAAGIRGAARARILSRRGGAAAADR